MASVDTITKIAADVVGRTTHAVTHPVATVTNVAGRARRAAAAVVAGGSSGSGGSGASSASNASSASGDKAREGQGASSYPEAPTPHRVRPQEPSTTEPKAASPAARHAGRGGEPTDDWQDELDDGPDVTTPVGTTGAGPGSNPDTGETDLQQPDTAPLMDPSLTKAAKAEAEMMRKAAENPQR